MDIGLCGFECRGDVLLFEGYRWLHAQGGVSPGPVVGVLGPAGDAVDGLRAGGEGVPVVVLGLQRGSERFLLGVVPAHPGPPDRQTHVHLGRDLGEPGRGVLAAPVGVKDHPVRTEGWVAEQHGAA